MSIDKFPNSNITSPEENDIEVFNEEVKKGVKKYVENFLNLDLKDENYELRYLNLITEFSNLDSDKEIFQQKQRLKFLENHLNFVDKKLNLLENDKENFLENANEIESFKKRKDFLEKTIKQIRDRLFSIDKDLLEDNSKRISEASAVSKEYVVGEYVDIEGKRYKKDNGAEVNDNYYAERVNVGIEPEKLIKKYKENIEWYLEKKKNKQEKNNTKNPFENNKDIDVDNIKTYKDMERVWNKIQAIEYPEMELDDFYLDELRDEKIKEFNQEIGELDDDIFSLQRKNTFESKLEKVKTFKDIEKLEGEFIKKLDFKEKQEEFDEFYKKNTFKIDDFESFKNDYNRVLVEYDLNFLRDRVKKGKYSYEEKLIENDEKNKKLRELEDEIKKSKENEESFLYKWAEKVINKKINNLITNNELNDEDVSFDNLFEDENKENIDDLIIQDEKKESIFGKFKVWIANKVIESKKEYILDNVTRKKIEDKKNKLEKEIKDDQEFFANFDENFEKTQQLWNNFVLYSPKINIKNYKKYNEKIRKDIEERYPNAVIPNYLVINGEKREINFRKSYQEDLMEEVSVVEENYRDEDYNKILEKIPKVKTYNDVKEIKEEILKWKKENVDKLNDKDEYDAKEKIFKRKIDFTAEEMNELEQDFDRIRKLVKELDEIQNRLENPSLWDFFKSNKVRFYNEANKKWEEGEFKTLDEIKEFREKNEIDKKNKDYKDKFVVFRIADI